MIRNWRILQAVVSAAMLMALLAAGAPVRAQAPVIKFSDDAWWEVMSNRYISMSLGVVGDCDLGGTNNKYDIAGRYAVNTAEGDPEIPGDNNYELINLSSLCPLGYWGFFKVKVADKVKLVGDANAGRWLKVPTTYPAPPPGLGLGRAGGFIDSEWAVTDAGKTLASLRIKMSLVRDQIRFEFTLTNRSAANQNIGLLMEGDVNVDMTDRSGTAFVPGVGVVRTATVSSEPLAQLLSGKDIPDVFETYDSVDSPGVVARNTLRLQDCVAPDYLAIGEWTDFANSTTWLSNTDYTPDPMNPIVDLAWVLAWNPTMVRPGATRKIVTYYGVGAATAAWTYTLGRSSTQDSASLAVQGPRSLKYDSTSVGQNDLDPAPFTVKAYVYNLATDPGPYDLDDVVATLYLPRGLQLAPRVPAQTAQQSIGRVPVNSEALPASWLVQATGEYSGELEYFITARAKSGWQQVVSRKIMVPATKKNVFRYGYQLMHVPFTFNNLAIDHVFGLPSGSFGARYYDPVSNQYLPVTQIKPGQSFWMYVGNVARGATLPYKLADDAQIVGVSFGKQLEEQHIDLLPGWNLIGNPFVYPVYWGQALVMSKAQPESSSVSLDQAVKNGWLSKTVFSWVPESSYYESFQDNDRLLLPWRGYWVRAKAPVTLIFRPAVFPASDVTANPNGM